MKLLINETDAGFLRQVLQAMLTSVPFPREQRRKLERVKDKISASRGLWNGFSAKTTEIELLHAILSSTIGSLDTEIRNLSEAPSTPESGTEQAKEATAIRLNQLELHKQYAMSVKEKIRDTLIQDYDSKPYISQSTHKAEAANETK